MPRVLLSIILAVFLSACSDNRQGTSSSPTVATTATLSAQVDAIFAPIANEETPGCAVLVVQDGEIVHAKGYGMADLERKVPHSSDTAGRLGSVGKQFTAMGIMILADRGELSFDDPATKYIPELSTRYGNDITIRHLLTHRAGLPDYYAHMARTYTERMPTNEDCADVYEKWGEPRFQPGERFEYSNPGYEMLGLIITRVSKLSFPEFMKQHIFTPLEMNDSLVMEHFKTHFPNRTYGYRQVNNKYLLDDDHHLNMMYGAGGFYSTLNDMYKWDQALGGEILVKQATLEAAFTPMVLNNGAKTNYGFGWMLDAHRGHRRIQHGGSWIGFRAHIARYPDDKLTIVALANFAHAATEAYVAQITDLYLNKRP
jgi:CubicO group peptidase (beta-lactamase class C family)